MAIKFKNVQVEKTNNTEELHVYYWTRTDRQYNSVKGFNIYMVAAYSIEEAVEMLLDKCGENKWVEKTRQDFRRQDHYNAWVDHNRSKEYAKYLKAHKKETDTVITQIKEIPNTIYKGYPGVYYTEYIKLI